MKKFIFILFLPFIFIFSVYNVNAKQINSIWNPFTTSNIQTVDNMDSQSIFNFNSGYFSNWGYGNLRFNFSLLKVSGSATDPLVVPSNVSVNNYVCDISTTSIGNSTFTGSTYTAVCPMIMGSNGLDNLVIFLTPFQGNTTSLYRITVGMLFTFEKVDDITLDTSGTTSAINNQITNDNSNTQSIINNQDSNTQDIINNQDTNTQDMINSQMSCSDYDKSSIFLDNHYLGSSGGEPSNSSFGITNYLKIDNNSKITIIQEVHQGIYMCFYNVNKTLISCLNEYLITGNVVIPNDTSYVRLSIHKLTDRPQFTICKNGNQAIVDSQQEINNTLNDDNVDEPTSEASSFFGNFQSNSHGLSGIISAPLRLIQSLSTSTCSSLSIPLPFVQNNATIPCMSTVYNQFPTFLSLWQLITTGLIGYWVLVRLFSHVKGFQDPQKDRVEVLDL